MARLAGLISSAALLAACSPEPTFGGGGGASASSESTASSPASSGSTTSGGDGGQAPSGSTSSVIGGGGEGGESQQSSAGGAAEGGGEPGLCVVASDCPEPDDPCVERQCDDRGVCFFSPLDAGTDGGTCGVCQGGMWLGSCGMRLWTRPFPNSETLWTSTPISDSWNDPNAPPPDGIDEAEHTRASGRLLVFHENGMVYERVVGTWQPPVTVSTRFGAWAAGSRVGAAFIWKPEEANALESMYLTTRDDPPQVYVYDLIDGGTTITLVAGPQPLEAEADPEAPPQEETPFDWGFITQAGYLGASNDWVIFWEGLGGNVHQLWGGNFDYVSADPDATSPLGIDGVNAPDPGSVRAAWYQSDTVHMLAP